jgi:hypothetical protein
MFATDEAFESVDEVLKLWSARSSARDVKG